MLWLLYLLSFIGGTVSKNLIMWVIFVTASCTPVASKRFWLRNAKHPWSVSYNCPAPKVPEACGALAFQRLRRGTWNCHDTKYTSCHHPSTIFYNISIRNFQDRSTFVHITFTTLCFWGILELFSPPTKCIIHRSARAHWMAVSPCPSCSWGLASASINDFTNVAALHFTASFKARHWPGRWTIWKLSGEKNITKWSLLHISLVSKGRWW